MAIYDPTRADDEEDDWFGEGSVFDSGEELAAALLAMSNGEPGPPPVAIAEEPPLERPRQSIFEIIRPYTPERDTRQRTEAEPAQPLTWSVRAPGVVVMPPRQPGRTGWSIRSSVQVLRQTEEVMDRLREDAVASAFSAAARALRPAG
ncbi:MAG: hypothetical protein JOY80_00380 [Candidatus Dormibacteraeota bacterium]|nr:hypothetical protein [Candidatus Dormibacteraeota bacterium]